MGNNGRQSKSFQNGSNPHIGASRSQSGQPRRSGQPTRQQKQSGGQSFGEKLWGVNPSSNKGGFGYGSGTRKKKR